MSSRTLTATAVLALLLAAAGCSSATKTPSPAAGGSTKSGGNANTSATLPECPTSAAISAALGIDYGALTQGGNAKERNCSYPPSSVETGLASVSFQILAGPGDFAGVKAGYSGGRTVTAIEGLGDDGFASVLNAAPSPKNTVAVRKGLLMILVSSFAPVDKEKALVASLLT